MKTTGWVHRMLQESDRGKLWYSSMGYNLILNIVAKINTKSLRLLTVKSLKGWMSTPKGSLDLSSSAFVSGIFVRVQRKILGEQFRELRSSCWSLIGGGSSCSGGKMSLVFKRSHISIPHPLFIPPWTTLGPGAPGWAGYLYRKAEIDKNTI